MRHCFHFCAALLPENGWLFHRFTALSSVQSAQQWWYERISLPVDMLNP